MSFPGNFEMQRNSRGKLPRAYMFPWSAILEWSHHNVLGPLSKHQLQLLRFCSLLLPQQHRSGPWDTLEPDPILVNQVDAGFFCWTRLRWIRTLFPCIPRKIPKGRMSIVKVDTSTLEQLALIQVFARIIWGKVKARRYSLIKSYMDLPQIPLDRHNGGRHQCWCNLCSRRTSSHPPCTRQGHGSLDEAWQHLKE